MSLIAVWCHTMHWITGTYRWFVLNESRGDKFSVSSSVRFGSSSFSSVSVVTSCFNFSICPMRFWFLKISSQSSLNAALVAVLASSTPCRQTQTKGDGNGPNYTGQINNKLKHMLCLEESVLEDFRKSNWQWVDQQELSACGCYEKKADRATRFH